MTKKKGRSKQDKSLREHYDRTSSLDQGRAVKPASLSFPKPRRLGTSPTPKERIGLLWALRGKLPLTLDLRKSRSR